MKRVIFNQKGGVGKSSIACNLAAIAASRGRRTLVIDLDAQGNSSHYLLGKPDAERPTIHDYFATVLGYGLRARAILDYVCATGFDNLDVIAAHPDLEQLETRLQTRNKIYKLRDLLNELSESYDEIFIDTAPAMNFYTHAALIGADSCLIPFDCDAFSRQSLYGILDVIAEIREDHNPGLVIEGIIANLFQPRARLPAQLVAELKAEGQPVLPVMLNQSVKMRESHNAGRPLVYLAPKHPLTSQFNALYDCLT